MKTSEIQIRDPFILPLAESRWYYLFGTTDKNCWSGPPEGFDCYRSHDLEEWEGPFPAFRPPEGFWGELNFWAPEVHPYRGRFYMFASFKAEGRYRGTQILVADDPAGPYVALTDRPVTPENWECLDGTLYVDENETPWVVFCHEWVQVHNGGVCATHLRDDLTGVAGRPVHLFNASEAPWVRKTNGPTAPAAKPLAPDPATGSAPAHRFPCYVTDGPFLYRTRTGRLLMLWSSHGAEGYAMGIARSLSGEITGPWEQEPEPIWGRDGGHGMIFRAFDGRLFITVHSPNQTPLERPFFSEIEDLGDTVRLKSG